VFIAVKKCSELLKTAAELGHVDVVCELLKIGASVYDMQSVCSIDIFIVVIDCIRLLLYLYGFSGGLLK
jgi:hypothetical protein